jgi:hypothetical protein
MSSGDVLHAIESFNPFFGCLPYASGSAVITR